MPLLNQNENFEEKKVMIADVDDTICESCQQISPKMAKHISKMVKEGYEWAFISGTKSVDLIKMISSLVKVRHHILGTTGTNYVKVEDDKHYNIYNFSFDQKQKKEIIDAFEELCQNYNIRSLTTKEDQIQDRDSQITLSAIGRHAPKELKVLYDPDGRKRLLWVEYLKTILGENKYDLKIGGTTSIDITKKGLDKEWGIRKFLEQNNWKPEQALFFGDRIHPGGNDYPATRIVDCISVKNPQETLQKLKELNKN